MSYCFVKRKQLEIKIGLLKPEAYKSITTVSVKAFDDLYFNYPAKAAISEKMIKDFDSNIIAYGIRLPESSVEILPSFAGYDLFVYDLRRNSSSLTN